MISSNFMLSWAEHEKSFITSGPDLHNSVEPYQSPQNTNYRSANRFSLSTDSKNDVFKFYNIYGKDGWLAGWLRRPI